MALVRSLSTLVALSLVLPSVAHAEITAQTLRITLPYPNACGLDETYDVEWLAGTEASGGNVGAPDQGVIFSLPSGGMFWNDLSGDYPDNITLLQEGLENFDFVSSDPARYDLAVLPDVSELDGWTVSSAEARGAACLLQYPPSTTLSFDLDNDGLFGDDDACPRDAGDGLDGCPSVVDSDGDSVPDDEDICPGSDDLADLDADGTPDNCDTCPSDPLNSADDDPVCDDIDACPDEPGQGWDGCPTPAVALTMRGTFELTCVDGSTQTVDVDVSGEIPEDAPARRGIHHFENTSSGGSGIYHGDDDRITFYWSGYGLTTQDHGLARAGRNQAPIAGQILVADVGLYAEGCSGDEYAYGNLELQTWALDDSDHDGVYDYQDNCPGGDDTTDLDADGTPDGCDLCPDDAEDDLDGDGYCGDVDACPGGDDNLDSDGDGTADDCDICPESSDNDTDGDLLCDVDDPCPLDADGEDDLDGDTVCNSDDLCNANTGGWLGASEDDLLDFDGDRVPDGCDLCVNHDDDEVCDSDDTCYWQGLGGDADVDGVCDTEDDCPFDLFDDSDGDSTCDSEDICPGADDFLDGDGDTLVDCRDACPSDVGNDGDGDGLCESVDNCPGVDNPDQADADGDLVGNACEPDSDADGWIDDGDNCPFAANASQADTDTDGQGDACDADDDGDGVTDAGDQCSATPASTAVTSRGCSAAQTCSPTATWKNHGAYVSCVTGVAGELYSRGAITSAQRSALVTDVARSSVGKR